MHTNNALTDQGNLVITVRADNGIQVCHVPAPLCARLAATQAAAGVVIRNNIVYDTASDGISITTNPEHLMPGPLRRAPPPRHSLTHHRRLPAQLCDRR